MIPKHTFSEAVIVNGKTFYLKQWYDHPVEVDCVVAPFTDENGRPYQAWVGYPATLAKVRKAVIATIKRWDSMGMKWDRRVPQEMRKA